MAVTGPTILGRDVAGTVVRTGPGVTGFTPGDAVVGLTTGTHAELAVVPATHCFPRPAALDAVHAAAVPTAGRTASTRSSTSPAYAPANGYSSSPPRAPSAPSPSSTPTTWARASSAPAPRRRPTRYAPSALSTSWTTTVPTSSSPCVPPCPAARWTSSSSRSAAPSGPTCSRSSPPAVGWSPVASPPTATPTCTWVASWSRAGRCAESAGPGPRRWPAATRGPHPLGRGRRPRDRRDVPARAGHRRARPLEASDFVGRIVLTTG